MDILTLITSLRDSDPYIHTIYTEGSCYKFHLFLKKIWPTAVPVINDTADHVASFIDGVMYDIDGVADWDYRAISVKELAMVEKWSFAGNSFLQVGECPACEEPIIV